MRTVQISKTGHREVFAMPRIILNIYNQTNGSDLAGQILVEVDQVPEIDQTRGASMILGAQQIVDGDEMVVECLVGKKLSLNQLDVTTPGQFREQGDFLPVFRARDYYEFTG